MSEKQVSDEIHQDLVNRLNKAGIYWVSREREFVNVDQKYKRTGGGKHYTGYGPSKPGNYPHKLSGQLMKSITYEVDADALTLYLGSNLKGYPKFLQLGTRFMRPRPWLTMGFEATKPKLNQIISG